MSPLIAFMAILVLILLLLLFTRLQQRRQEEGRFTELRPLPACNNLGNQMGAAIESGRQLHVSLGRASLTGMANPTSLAALNVLDHLAKDGCASGVPPLTTVGEGTLLPMAQDGLRNAYVQAGRVRDFKPGMAQFVAANTDPFAFAGGLASIIQQHKTGGNVLVGRYGLEAVIPLEAAVRQNMDQVVGTDDPSALAAATAVTDNLLVGEELFAAGAYLEGSPGQIASLQLQDLLRVIIVLTIVGLAVYQFAVG